MSVLACLDTFCGLAVLLKRPTVITKYCRRVVIRALGSGQECSKGHPKCGDFTHMSRPQCMYVLVSIIKMIGG